MKRAILSLFFVSINIFSQESIPNKLALVIGDDCKSDQNMAKYGADTAKALKARGYKVSNLYGSKSRAQQMSSEFLKDTNIKTQELSLDSIKESLNEVYSQNCENRPEQLMLNFVAHGSYNGGNHTLCTRDGQDPIPVRFIANHVKSLQAKSPDCIKPLLAVVDTSCKSGGSIKEFEGLGCTLTTTSTYNQTNFGFIKNYIDKIKTDKKMKNMSDLHLDLLLNRDYELLEKDYDNGKTILNRLFDNANQIAGCYDEDKADFNIALNKNLVQNYSPTCEDPVAILNLRREKEITEIEKIVKKLNLNMGIDRSTIARIKETDASKIPSSENLISELDSLIKEDQTQSEKLNQALLKEAELMTNPELKNMSPCKLTLPKTSKHVLNDDLKKLDRIISSNTSPYPEQKISIVKALCHIHTNKENFSRCVKNESSGYLNIGYAELMRLEKSYNLLQSDAKDDQALKIINTTKKENLNVNIPVLLELYKETVSECVNKAKASSNTPIKNAANFVRDQYQVDEKNCQDQIGCQIVKANNREKKIKNYLGTARAYFFLQCRDQFNKNDDLKTCDDFRL